MDSQRVLGVHSKDSPVDNSVNKAVWGGWRGYAAANKIHAVPYTTLKAKVDRESAASFYRNSAVVGFWQALATDVNACVTGDVASKDGIAKCFGRCVMKPQAKRFALC